ncbi:MAG: NAD-dependent epimerase/dehydratase family protein [Brevundimonas sp.]
MAGGGSVLVTGATGFLGSHLVRRLLAQGQAVHVLARPDSDFRRLRDDRDRLTVWTGDVTDFASVREACRGARPEAIFHLAGDTSLRAFSGDWASVERAAEVGINGLLNLLRAASEAALGLRCVVRTGGLEEYGAGPSPFVETQREAPCSPYSFAQVACAHLSQMMQPHLAFAVVTLRPTLIYGPDQSSEFLIPSLIRSLLRGRRFTLTEGRQRRDLLHVDDFVSAALAAAQGKDLRGAVLNIANGEGHAIRDVAMRIAGMLDATDRLDIGGAPERASEIFDLVGDATLARERIGWRPEVSLEDGLARTIAWHRSEHLMEASA